MAIFIIGMKCGICGLSIDSKESATILPNFSSNTRDPLFDFSDGVFHKECYRNHPLRKVVDDRIGDVLASALPENRISMISGSVITDPDDYFGFGFLTSDEKRGAFRLNYQHLKLSELQTWPGKESVLRDLLDLARGGEWEEQDIDFILSTLGLEN